MSATSNSSGPEMSYVDGNDRSYRPTYDKTFDFTTPVALKSKLFFASLPRCGSHFVCNTAYHTRQMGLPLEYFHPGHWGRWKQRAGAKNAYDTLSLLVKKRTGPNGCFSAKIHWTHMRHIMQLGIGGWFKRANWVFIERNNLIGQAVSWSFASRTGSWIALQKASKPKPEYNFDDILGKMVTLTIQKNAWQGFFATHEIKPYYINYESFLTHPETAAAQLALDMQEKFSFDQTAHFPEIPTVRKQTDKRKSLWHERFLEDLYKTYSTTETQELDRMVLDNFLGPKDGEK